MMRFYEVHVFKSDCGLVCLQSCSDGDVFICNEKQLQSHRGVAILGSKQARIIAAEMVRLADEIDGEDCV